MMKQYVLGGVLAISALFASQWGVAASLETNMHTLATGYKSFSDSANPQQATNALNQMRAAAVDSKKFVPTYLKKDPQKAKTYQAGFDDLITAIDKTNALVKAGKLAQAKQEGKKLLDIRDSNHQKFR